MAKRKSAKHRKNPKGTKKMDKIHGTKKGRAGEAAAYITRAQALAKLQLPLADFRKLCILKGIYPRDPKKKSHGMDKTYYHHKDINFLAHEPLLNKFFELKTFMKKFKRLMGRGEKDLARGLEGRKPDYTLHHLVRERYPSFDDAVRDQKREIPTESVNEATRLYQEFSLWVIRSQSLRKVFASIKGFYYQAEVCGQQVTWLSPHQFTQEMPEEVDFKVMLTFLEFYRSTVKFVNFRLYGELGLTYPPKRDEKRDKASAGVAVLEVEMREAGEARKSAKEAEEEADKITADVARDFGDESAEALALQRQAEDAKRMKTVFRNLRVFVNREVPLRPVYFTLLCGGAQAVAWERGASLGGGAGPGSSFQANDKQITHQIVDRPPDQLDIRPGREYVQPQWVFDSFNTGVVLPVAPYAPGRSPPPHLSPFVDDKAEGYVPRQREILDRFAAEAVGGASKPADGEENGAAAAAKPAAKSGYEDYVEGLQEEKKGKWHSTFAEEERTRLAEKMEQDLADAANAALPTEASDEPTAAKKGTKKRRKAPAAAAPEEKNEDLPDSEDLSDEEEEVPSPVYKPVVQPSEAEEARLSAKALMSKKHKRLLQRIEKGAANKQASNERLKAKRRKIEASG